MFKRLHDWTKRTVEDFTLHAYHYGNWNSLHTRPQMLEFSIIGNFFGRWRQLPPYHPSSLSPFLPPSLSFSLPLEWEVGASYSQKVPFHYQVLSDDRETKCTVAMGADRLWLHRRTVSCVRQELRMPHFYQTHYPTVTSTSVCRKTCNKPQSKFFLSANRGKDFECPTQQLR